MRCSVFDINELVYTRWHLDASTFTARWCLMLVIMLTNDINFEHLGLPTLFGLVVRQQLSSIEPLTVCLVMTVSLTLYHYQSSDTETRG